MPSAEFIANAPESKDDYGVIPRGHIGCVQACPFGARRIGNLKDHDDPVTTIIMNQRVAILKDEYGTKPQVFYIGLDRNVR